MNIYFFLIFEIVSQLSGKERINKITHYKKIGVLYIINSIDTQYNKIHVNIHNLNTILSVE